VLCYAAVSGWYLALYDGSMLIAVLVCYQWQQTLRTRSCTYFSRILPFAWPAVVFNPLESKGTYSATSNNMTLVHWPLIFGLSHLVHRGGDWAGPHPAMPLLAVYQI